MRREKVELMIIHIFWRVLLSRGAKGMWDQGRYFVVDVCAF